MVRAGLKATAYQEITMHASRRRFLTASGVALALPWMESLSLGEPSAGGGASGKPPRRMVSICMPLGFHPEDFFPQNEGRDYTASPYMELFQELRPDFTVISGLAHRDVGHSHDSMFSFLTGAPHPELRAGFRNSISLDQLAAEHIGGETRFPSLALSCEGFSLSWTRSGALVPSHGWPSALFAQLFLAGKPHEQKAQVQRLQDGQSILDALGEQSRAVRSSLPGDDRAKLEEYFTSVRELEQRLAISEAWAHKPKPTVDAQQPVDNSNPTDVVGKARLMLDLMRLAIQTDSTRLMTLLLMGTSGVPPVEGVSLGHHDLSHHGQDPAKIDQLRKVEVAVLTAMRDFLSQLKAIPEQDGNLLDHTSVFLSSNLGNASSHSVSNLPILLAGGGFDHGKHLAFDPKSPPPLCNLYVSMLQRLGLEVDQFGSSTGTLTGI